MATTRTPAESAHTSSTRESHGSTARDCTVKYVSAGAV